MKDITRREKIDFINLKSLIDEFHKYGMDGENPYNEYHTHCQICSIRNRGMIQGWDMMNRRLHCR